MRKPLFILVMFLMVAGSLVTGVDACPNCKNAVANTGNWMVSGFAWSIGLMILVPGAIISAWTILLRRLPNI